MHWSNINEGTSSESRYSWPTDFYSYPWPWSEGSRNNNAKFFDLSLNIQEMVILCCLSICVCVQLCICRYSRIMTLWWKYQSFNPPADQFSGHQHKINKWYVFQVFDASRKVKDICKSKHVKCVRVVQGRLYIGCMDSSIQVGLRVLSDTKLSHQSKP